MIKSNTTYNTSIICVDDEAGVLESYRDVLVPDLEKDLFSEILDDEEQQGSREYAFSETKLTYTLFLAKSGEEAVEIVRNELSRGNRIAAGFFDMRMPGGMDGYETIKLIKEIDPDVFCAIVTAYYDRTLDQIRQLFPDDHQDELLYFKKPFSALELKQTAFNLVSSWNRKRSEERHIRELTKAYERLRAETEERERLNFELRYARKMEVVGRLAGGVAHDFNNLLTPIVGYSDLSLLILPDDHPVKEYITIINEAGQSAAKVVRQLLAFSRKQIFEMQPACLNSIVANLANMLSRIIGEDIIIDLNIEKPTRTVLVDPVQIEQILMNIAVNARDAMPKGGRLSISVTDIDVEDDSFAHVRDIEPGQYVLLRVSDTGTGIEPDILEKIFEPFFTTKAKEKGTGLGLATVYGVVKQHNGFIHVDSTIGEGTIFEIYLPVTQESSEEKTIRDIKSMPHGSETVLVAEDDRGIRKLIHDTLVPLGYTVLEASNGTEALHISRDYDGKIDILLTDVIMPNMNGQELADKLKAEQPEMKVVFMSGYTDEVIAKHGMILAGKFFVQKPLYPVAVAGKIRAVLDGE